MAKDRCILDIFQIMLLKHEALIVSNYHESSASPLLESGDTWTTRSQFWYLGGLLRRRYVFRIPVMLYEKKMYGGRTRRHASDIIVCNQVEINEKDSG